MPAFFPYPGSKTRLMKHYVKLLPNHQHYVSVFGGSATDILSKPPSRVETYNDIDGHLHNVFQVVLNGQCEQLRERIANTHPRCRRVFGDALAIVQQPITDQVLSAWAFLVVSHQGLCVGHPSRLRPSNWTSDRSPNRTYRRFIRLPEMLAFVRRRMKHVQIENCDWSHAINRYDSQNTVFYLDPPYHPDAVKGRFYDATMSIEDHRKMLAKLQTIKGKAVLCGYHTPLYDAMLAHWRHEDVEVKSRIHFGETRPERTEVVWMNY